MEAVSVKPYKGMNMEGWIARWYAANTRKGRDHQALAQRFARELAPGSAVLEIAPGPGYFAIELAKATTCQITGLDISKTFVEIARRNAQEANVKIDFQQGDAAHTPFAGESFDFLFCAAAFKNFSQPVRALQEMYRVLRQGGAAVIIDLRRDASWKSISAAVAKMEMNWANALFTKFVFRFGLLRRAYTRREFEKMISQTEFHHADMQESLTGLEIRLQK